jgi:hypothetical protein
MRFGQAGGVKLVARGKAQHKRKEDIKKIVASGECPQSPFRQQKRELEIGADCFEQVVCS